MRLSGSVCLALGGIIDVGAFLRVGGENLKLLGSITSLPLLLAFGVN